MTNAVYTMTVHALSGVVSARAAETMLRSLLREQRLTPVTVTVQDIQRVLSGPLLARLSMVLPRAPTLFTDMSPVAAWDGSSDASGLPLGPLSLGADDFEFDDPGYVSVGPGRAQDLGSPAEQEALLRELARFSGVQGMMICRASGETVQSRSVTGASGLGRVVAATTLLLRGGTLRLMLADLGDRTVCMRPPGEYRVAGVVGAQANVGRLLVELHGLQVAA